MLAEKPWKPELVGLLLAGIFASLAIGVISIKGYQHFTGTNALGGNRDLVLFFVSVFCLHGVGLVLINVFLRLHTIGWSEAFGFNQPRRGRAIFLGIVSAVVMLPIAVSLSELSGWVMKQFEMPIQPQEAIRVLSNVVSTRELIIHAIAAILLAPFVEELIFRGILYPTLKQGGHPKLALWGTAILFSMMHSTPKLILPLTVLAVILTFLYETTNNLLAPIVMHSFFNAVNYGYMLYHRFTSGEL